MKKNINLCIALLLLVQAQSFGQAVISPAKPQSKQIALVGGTIHTGTGQVIENAYITFDKGKIIAIGDATVVRFDTNNTNVISAAGKHIYPGFIAPVTSLGLIEVESGAKGTDDVADIGEVNPHIRSIIAYNTDSKIIPTVRSNGILMAQPTPQGGLISGQSSVVQLDAWNWEDAAYKTDVAVHLNWPVMRQSRSFFPSPTPAGDPKEEHRKKLEEIEKYFTEAKAYADLSSPNVVNARFEAMKGLFTGDKKLFVDVNSSKDIIAVVALSNKLGMKPVIVGGNEAHLVTDLLKSNNIPVILVETQHLPDKNDDDVYLPYKMPKILHDAGILYALTGTGYWRQRNLPFEAGTAAAYGLTKEQALAMITLNTAKILGIDKSTGSLEVGKDATLFISGGDALDMRGNKVEAAYIQGRDINLDNLHKELYKKYAEKYGVE